MTVDLTLPAGIFCLARFHLNDEGKPEMKELMGIYLECQGQEVDITTSCLGNLTLMNSIEQELLEKCKADMARLGGKMLEKLGMVK
jgi:hypothetical protein